MSAYVPSKDKIRVEFVELCKTEAFPSRVWLCKMSGGLSYSRVQLRRIVPSKSSMVVQGGRGVELIGRLPSLAVYSISRHGQITLASSGQILLPAHFLVNDLHR